MYVALSGTRFGTGDGHRKKTLHMISVVKMKPADKASLLYALKPVNKTRLNDQHMSDVFRVVPNERKVPIIDSLWTTQLLTNGSVAKQDEYLERIRPIMDALPNLVLFPLFDDEHWSLLALIYRPVVANWCYLHLDSSGTTHIEHRTALLSRLEPILRGGLPVPFVMPKNKKVPQQTGEWECGHFVLMNSRMLLSLECPPHQDYETSLSRYLIKELLSSSSRNLRAFIKDIIHLVGPL